MHLSRRLATSLIITCAVLMAQQAATAASAVATLAESLIDADIARRQEFADVMLGVLLSTYDAELEHAARDQPTSTKGKEKLRRWRRATNALIETLIDARLRLSEGASVTIDVDPRKQVLLFVGGRAIAFSAPRPGGERRMERALIEQYCALDDCGAIASLGGQRDHYADRNIGSWSLRAGATPTYELRNGMSCAFADLTQRHAKQRACIEANDEAVALADEIRELIGRGQIVDWEAFVDGRSPSGPDTMIQLRGDGTSIRQTMPRLSRLDENDWAELSRWLKHRVVGESIWLSISDGERLLDIRGTR